MKLTLRFVLLISLLSVSCAVTFAQVQTGLPPFATYGGGSYDQINLANLNVHLTLPIMGKPGRGVPFAYNLGYDSSIWTPVGSSGSQTWALASAMGFNAGLQAWNGLATYTFTGGCQQLPWPATGQICTYDYSNFAYRDANATLHSSTYYSDEFCYTTCTYYTGGSPVATDASGYTMSGSFALDRAGTTFMTTSGAFGTAGSIEDTNGNYVSANVSGSNYVLTDTQGQKVITMPKSWSGSTVTLTTPTGTVTVYYGTYSVRTNFGCSGISEYGPTNKSLPYMIKLPDGTAYTLNYEKTPNYADGHVTGRISSIGLSSGETISYVYTGANDGISCTDGSTLGLQRLADSATTYSRSGGQTTVTLQPLPYDSAANQTVYTFDSNGHETSRQIYQGSVSSSDLRRTVATTWTSGTPTKTITTLEDNATQSEVDTTYDAYGNLTSKMEYDWGSGAHGALLRTTAYTFNNSYGGIADLLTDETIADGGGIKYRKHLAYDQPTIMVCPTGVTNHDDSGHGCSYTSRGNLTSVTTYLAPSANPPSQPIVKNFTYDVFGNKLTAQLNCCQSKTWTFSATTSYTFPDSVTTGSGSLQLAAQYTYNLATGNVATVKDPNNLTVQYSYDGTGRVTGVTRPDGSKFSIAYNPGSSFTYNGQTYTIPGGTTETSPVDANFHSIVQVTTVDSLGRPQVVTVKDSGGNVYSNVQFQYDPLGRVWQTSNPYTSTASYWTKNQFDALGRPTVTILPDSRQTAYSYHLQTATVTDPAGKQKEAQADAAGRLVSVFEPDVNNGNSLTQKTSYSYDVLDDLVSVSQGQQTRTYVYDALGRLNSVTTPEAGMVCFGTFSSGQCQSNGYDSFDNLLSRTDARGVVANYTYDGLNRLTAIGYSVPQGSGVSAMPNNVCDPTGGSNPSANTCFYYGQGGAAAFALGKITKVIDPSGSESYAYDSIGRKTQVQKVIGNIVYTTAYQYNYAGEVTQFTYPSGRTVTPGYDAIGRLATVSDTMNGINKTYASGFTYDSAQHVTGFSYGNGVTTSVTYSPDRLLLSSIAYANAISTLFSVNFSYQQSAGNNDQITSVADSVDAGRSATYGYDALGRLNSAATTGDTVYPSWGLNWTYDRYGNRLMQNIASGCIAPMTCPTNSVDVNPATNRISTPGYTYDASGNLTNDGQNTLGYDGENRLTSASGSLGSGTYLYDANGLRVQKTSGGATTAYVFSGSQVIAEYSVSGSTSTLQREYINASGTRVAKIEGGTTQYYHQDQLSTRLMTDANGNKIGEQGHYPYGEQWYATNTTTKGFFTSYERDSESNDDYALAREYVNRLGRFSALDPVGGSATDPQSFSKYPYAGSDPINKVDPSGQDCWSIDGGACLPDYFFPSGVGFGLDEFDLIIPQQIGTLYTFWTQDGGNFNFDNFSLSDLLQMSQGDDAELNEISQPIYGSLGPGLVGLPAGGPQSTVDTMRSALRTALLKDPDCLKFLGQAGAQVLNSLDTVPITVSDQSQAGPTAATHNTYNPGSSLPASSSIYINKDGAFFVPGFGTTFAGQTMNTGAPQLQAAILLHEMGHVTNVLERDFNNKGAGDRNNNAIMQHCKKTISSFSNQFGK